MPVEITKAEFIAQWSTNIITDPVGPVNGHMYGKRAESEDHPAEIVYCVL